MFSRWPETNWRKKFTAPYVHIVFGARQTGKSTLIQSLLPPHAVKIDLSIPKIRAQYTSRGL